MKENQVLVLWFAAFVAVLVLSSAYFTDHNGDIDELGLFNPSYMLATYGKLTYPAHGYYEDPVIVHPPIHVGAIGVLMRAGLPWHYAEATPAALFFLLTIALTAILPVPAVARLGILFSVGFLSLGGTFTMHWAPPWGLLFGTRPEGHLLGAWLSGLLFMENGRLRGWAGSYLAAGAFISAWASAVHYFAWAALLGALIYVLLAILDRGWKPARPAAIALIGGACLFGVPYLALYVIPNWASIMQVVRDAGGAGSIADSVRAHFSWYRTYGLGSRFTTPLRLPFAIGVPLFVWSALILSLVRPARGFALASIPLPLSIFLFASHKPFSYLIYECSLFLAAGSVALLTAVNWLVVRAKVSGAQRYLMPASALILGMYILFLNDVVSGVMAAGEPVLQEGEIARASARAILGPRSKVTSRIGLWYSSGGAYWHDVKQDLLENPPSYDPLRYLSNFDAAAEHWQSSELHAPGGTTLSTLYADGALQLRGFYFGETNPELRFVLLSPQRPDKVVGYALRNSRLFRFEEQPSGDHAVSLSRCAPLPKDAEVELKRTAASWAMVALPVQAGHNPEILFHLLSPRSASPLPWMNGCTTVSTFAGTLVPVDKGAMIDALRREDQPIRFASSLDELPGYREIGVPPKLDPPKEGVRLDHVLIHPAAKPVTTPRGSGSFAVNIRAEHGDAVNVPCWVQLRLRVLHGRIGIIAWNEKDSERHDAGAYLGKTQQPVNVALRLPRLTNASYVTVYNATGMPSEVEVLDATVMVSPQVWTSGQAALAAVR